MNKKINVTLQQMQKIESNILKEFDAYCRENNYRYYVAYGTLLGLIRHKGFIPWDDDIDIVMPRRDYDRMIQNNYIGENMEILSRRNREDWPYIFAKCVDNTTEMIEKNYKSGNIGVYIDIFPIDGLPKNRILSNIHVFKVAVLSALLLTLQKTDLTSKSKFKGLLKKFIYPFANFIGLNNLLDIIEKIIKKYDYESAEYVGVQAINVYLKKEKIKKTLVDEYERKIFEGFEVNAPIGYDKLLSNIYGDYMKLPEESKRISHHSYEVRFK